MLLLFLFISLINFVFSYNTILIKTNEGIVKGTKETALYSNDNYYAFRGIPYAQPPVGELRFLPPKPAEPRVNTLDASNFAPKCVQYSEGNEDCLYLNIYTPKTNPSKSYPVMFFISGYGYVAGASDDQLYGPDFFVKEDVVLVTMNYRLGIFGFLKINGSPLYTGNMGLKDQCLAMKWVYDNIENFGGDKHKITLFGQGSGSASAHLQSLSHCGKKYIHRLILQGSTVNNIYAYNLNPNHADILRAYATELSVPTTTDAELINFMKTVNANDLSVKTNPGSTTVKDGTRVISIVFQPVVEDPTVANAFMIERPEILFKRLKDSDIDLLIGSASDETVYFMKPELDDNSMLAIFNTEFKIQMPRPGNQVDDYDSQLYKDLTKKIREYYFEQQAIDNSTFRNYVDLINDIFFTYGVQKTAKKYSTFPSATTYFYRFSFDAALNYYKHKNDVDYGNTVFGDELCYLFRCHVIDNLYDDVSKYSLEYYLIKHLVNFWTNFAKYGDPTPYERPVYWRATAPKHLKFLDIANNKFAMEDSDLDKIHFWDDILKAYSAPLPLPIPKKL